MKQLRITVAGQTFDVTVETVGGTAPVALAPAPVAAAPAGGEKVTSPMPGTILSVNVSNGASVKKGDVLFILEAMKMNTVIYAPANGTVTSFAVKPGDTVTEGQTLAYIG